MLGYQIAVFIHIIAAVTWLGGMLFLAMVLVPMARREMEPPSQGARLLARAGRKFRPVAWASIVLLVGSGLYIATDRWGVSASDFFGGEGYFFEALRAKVGLVIILIVLSAVHDFILEPRVARQLEDLRDGEAPSESLSRSRRALLALDRISFLLILTIVGLGVTLPRGAPL